MDADYTVVNCTIPASTGTFYKALYHELRHKSLLATFFNALGISSIALLKIERMAESIRLGERTFASMMRPVMWLLYNNEIDGGHDESAAEKRRILDPDMEADPSKEVSSLMLALLRARFVLRLINQDTIGDSNMDDNCPVNYGPVLIHSKFEGNDVFGWIDSDGVPQVAHPSHTSEIFGEIKTVDVLHIVINAKNLETLCDKLVETFTDKTRHCITQCIGKLAHAQKANEKIKHQLADAEAALSATIDRRDTYIMKSKLLQSQVDDECEKMRTGIAHSEAVAKQLTSNLRNKEHRLVEVNKRLSAVEVVVATTEEKRAGAHDKLAEAEENLSATYDKLFVVEETRCMVEKELRMLEGKIRETDVKIGAAEDKRADVTIELDSVKNKIVAICAEVETARSEEDAIERELIARKKRMDAMQKELHFEEMKNAIIHTRMADITTRIKICENDIASMAAVCAARMQIVVDMVNKAAEIPKTLRITAPTTPI